MNGSYEVKQQAILKLRILKSLVLQRLPVFYPMDFSVLCPSTLWRREL